MNASYTNFHWYIVLVNRGKSFDKVKAKQPFVFIIWILQFKSLQSPLIAELIQAGCTIYNHLQNSPTKARVLIG